MNINLETARRLADVGLYVFPCQPNKNPVPGFKWKEWASNDPAEIEAIWRHYGGDPLPALHLGPCGLVITDLDRHSPDADGVVAFDALYDLNLNVGIPRGPIVETPSNGYHLYFRQPGGREPLGNNRGGLPAGIDIKGNGGYVIAPGAVKDDGTFYGIAAGWPDLVDAFASDTIPEIPEWLIGLIEAPRRVELLRGPSVAGPVSDYRAQTWGLAALDGEAAKLAATGVGGRNNSLNAAAYTLGGKSVSGCLSEGEVFSALWAACVTNGYLTSRDPSDGPVAFRKTFKNAWNAGLRRPLPGPRERYPENLQHTTTAAV
jgi:Bifunctional DNA primase/polymerase, N-terminal